MSIDTLLVFPSLADVPRATMRVVSAILQQVPDERKGAVKIIDMHKQKAQEFQNRIIDLQPKKIISVGERVTRAFTGQQLSIFQIEQGWMKDSYLAPGTFVQFVYHPEVTQSLPSMRGYIYASYKKVFGAKVPSWSSVGDTEVVVVKRQRQALLVLREACNNSFVAVDTEYNSKSNRLLCLALAISVEKAYAFPDYILKKPLVKALFQKLVRSTRICAHNWKFDAWVLCKTGILRTIDVLQSLDFWLDTSVLRKLAHPEQDADLNTVGWMVGMGGHKSELADILGTVNFRVGTIGARYEKAYDEYPNIVLRYCGYDAIATYRAYLYYARRLRREGFWGLWSEIFGPLGASLFAMEVHGLKIDREAMEVLDRRLKISMQQALNAIRSDSSVLRLCKNWDQKEGTEFNPKSTKHMQALLFGKHGLQLTTKNVDRTPKGSLKVDKHVVAAAKQKAPVMEFISEFNRLKHKHSTYVAGYGRFIQSDDCIRTSYRQDTARTQRLSSRQPNVQNTANRGFEEDLAIRRLFIPHDPDTEDMFEADYSQQELRMAADISNDPVMMDCFLSGKDIHVLTAANITAKSLDEVTKAERQSAKPVNFSSIFDTTKYGLQGTAEREYNVIMTVDEAERWLRGFFRLYHGYHRWMRNEQRLATKRGHAYVYWCGKPVAKRVLPNLGSQEWGKKAHALRQAINTPVQGGASLYTLRTINEIHARLRSGKLRYVKRVVNTIHDSVIVITAKNRAYETLMELADIMVLWPTIRVPLAIEGKIGPTFADMQPTQEVKKADVLAWRSKSGRKSRKLIIPVR